MTSSGSPGSSRAKQRVERSESERGSLKVRGCSSSIMDAHSHNHLHGSLSDSVPPRPCISLPGGILGFYSHCPSISSRSLSSKRGGGISSSSSSCICSCSSSSSCVCSCSSSSCVCSCSSSEEDLSVQEAVAPEPSDMVYFLGGMRHKIRQCTHHSLLSPAIIVGNPAGGDPLCLIPGGIICQDDCFEYEAMCHA